MKKLYVTFADRSVNGEDIYTGSSLYNSPWRYTEEMPADHRTEYDFKKVYEWFGYGQVTFFKKKPYVEFRMDFYTHKKFTADNFEKYEVIKYQKEIPEDSVTMSKLMERLPANEFIDYCKDHGLNACSINVGE